MSDPENIKRLQLRVNLLKVHLGQLKQYFAESRVIRNQLKVEHEKQRTNLKLVERERSVDWVSLIVRQAEELTALSQRDSRKQELMLAHQREEELQLDQQINQRKRPS